MEVYSSWNSQGPNYFPPLLLEMPLDKGSDMPLQLQDRLVYLGGYEDFDLYPRPVMATDTDPRLQCQQPVIDQMHNLSSTFPTTISPPVTPTGSDSDSQIEGETLLSYPIDPASQKPRVQSVKRRIQNRQAQRRFRERKGERQQTLEQNAANLEKMHQELSEQYRQKCEEASQLLQEKDTLNGEIQDLRKRWRLMVLLLQRPNGAQSLATLLADHSTPLSSGSLVTEPAPLDEWLGCLHALVLPNQTPHTSPS